MTSCLYMSLTKHSGTDWCGESANNNWKKETGNGLCRWYTNVTRQAIDYEVPRNRRVRRSKTTWNGLSEKNECCIKKHG